jgi:hypothetical protein
VALSSLRIPDQLPPAFMGLHMPLILGSPWVSYLRTLLVANPRVQMDAALRTLLDNREFSIQ